MRAARPHEPTGGRVRQLIVARARTGAKPRAARRGTRRSERERGPPGAGARQTPRIAAMSTWCDSRSRRASSVRTPSTPSNSDQILPPLRVEEERAVRAPSSLSSHTRYGQPLAREPAARDGGGDGEGGGRNTGSRRTASRTRRGSRARPARARGRRRARGDRRSRATRPARHRDARAAAPPGGGADGRRGGDVRARARRGAPGSCSCAGCSAASRSASPRSPRRAAAARASRGRGTRAPRGTAFQPSGRRRAGARADQQRARPELLLAPGHPRLGRGGPARDQRHALAPTLENAQRCGARRSDLGSVFDAVARS